MKQNTNHTTAATKTAATPKNTTPATQQLTPQRQYAVTPTTAVLLDCITDVADMYGRITDALELCYGATEVDNHTAPYLAAVNAITEQLHAELRERLTDALMVVTNAHAEQVQI